MGVKSLYKLLQSDCPAAKRPRCAEDYAGQTIGVDVSQAVYAWALGGGATMQHEGRGTAHIMGLLHVASSLVSAGITPVFVFDGQAPILKADVLAARRATRKFSFTADMATECQQLLALLGMPIMMADGEADALLGALCATGQLYAVMSDDSDMLPFGATRVWRARQQIEWSLPDILSGLGLDMAQFVQLCVALGTDYGNPVRGVGPKTVRKVLAAGDLTAHCGNDEWRKVAAIYAWRPASPVVVPPRTPLQYDAAAEFLAKLYGFSAQRIHRALQPLI